MRRSSSLRAKPSELEEWAAEIPRFATIRRGAQGLKMPAFREALTDCEIWQIVLFTKHMNSLPPGNSPGLGVTKSLAVAGRGSSFPPPRLCEIVAAFVSRKNDVPHPDAQRCLFLWARCGVSAEKVSTNEFFRTAMPRLASLRIGKQDLNFAILSKNWGLSQKTKRPFVAIKTRTRESTSRDGT